MFRNKVRIVLSSIGVIGSVALLTAGFSIRSIAGKVMDSTYDSLNYDLQVDFDGPLEDKSSIAIPVDVVALEYTDVRLATMKIADGVPVRAQIMENNSRMIVLFDPNGKEIPFQQDSCIIPQNIAEENGLHIGDPLSIEIGTDTYSFIITGINKQIFSKRVYLGETAAAMAGIPMEKNMIFVKLKESIFTERVMAGFQENIHVTGVTTKSNQVALAREVMSMLNALIAIIILASSILAVTVIYNITSVNIMERTHDYATMMALGYTTQQVNRIIIMENVALTLFGAVAGTPLGYVLYEYLRDAITRDDLTIGKDLTPLAAIGAILVSFALTALTNWLLRSKIQRIQLIQTLKALE
jgi:putative ABC transport system permease protein